MSTPSDFPEGEKPSAGIGSAPISVPLEGAVSEDPSRPTELDIPILACAMAAISVFAIVFGAAMPLSSLVMGRYGVSETGIGISAATSSLGLLLTVGFAPALAIRFGAWRVMVVSAVTCAVTILIQGAIYDYWLWLFLRFMVGVTSGMTYVLSESWVNMLTPDRVRGRVMGIYATVVSMGFAFGPLLLSVVGSEGITAWAILAAIMLVCAAFSIPIRNKLPPLKHEQGASIFSFAKLAPTLLVAIMAFSMMEGALTSLFPSYGQSVGLTEQAAILGIGVVLAGYMGPQIPIGWMAEKVGDRLLLLVVTFCGVIVSLIIPFAVGDSIGFWVLLFLWGSCGAALYTLALIELGNRFTGHMLVTGNAAIGVFWGIGGIVGPSSMGFAMDWTGDVALPISIALVFGTVFTVALVRRVTRAN